MFRLNVASIWTMIIAAAVCSSAASGQRQAPPETQEITATVVSASRNTLVVRTESDQFQLFVFDAKTQKPASIAVGSRVRVISRPGEESSSRIAEIIRVLEAPAAESKPGPGGASAAAEPIPASVREMERDIQRQAKRFRLGLRAGTALDPELFLIGAHAQMGPVFSPDIWFRPNVEFAFGEVTTLIGINLEAIYRLPVSQRQGRWSSYIGVGPAFNFMHQNFEPESTGIDFGDFNYKTGFNVLMGMQMRKGPFFEIKTSIYSEPAPTFRLIVGYNF